jgi:hypothetical protein
MTAASDVDRGALLCALVLAPTTFARNRFFAMFTESSAKRTRSRAAQLRTVVRHLSHVNPRAELVELSPQGDGASRLRYRIESLSLQRTALLERLELAVVRFALSRRTATTPSTAAPIAPLLELTQEDRALVVTAIAKLGERLDLPFALEEKSASAVGEGYHPPSNGGDS